MTPVIVDTRTNEVVYEGIDAIDCFDQLRHHFMANINNPGKYRVVDYDTMQPISYEDVRAVIMAARNMLAYGG